MKELERLRHLYWEALHQVELAADDDEQMRAWRRIQTLGWRLHELLPAAKESVSA
jgi:hypothetical protein